MGNHISFGFSSKRSQGQNTMKACSPFLFRHPGKEKGKIWTITILCLLSINATACNFASPKQNMAEPPPENLRKPLMTSVSVNDARELSKPATKNDGFGDQPDIILGSESKGHSMGLKTDLLFHENISGDNARFDRLENAVQDIHTNFNDIKPSIQRLVSVEKDLQDLMDQLDILLRNEPSAARQNTPINITPAQPAATKPVTQKTAPKKITKTKTLPKVDRSKAHIHAIRFGDHAGKTRLVIETTQNLKYSASLDQSENLLMLSFDKGSVEFNPADLSKKSKLVNAVTTTSEGSGSLIIIELAKASDLIKQGRIKPNKDNAYHRIFIDLKR